MTFWYPQLSKPLQRYGRVPRKLSSHDPAEAPVGAERHLSTATDIQPFETGRVFPSLRFIIVGLLLLPIGLYPLSFWWWDEVAYVPAFFVSLYLLFAVVHFVWSIIELRRWRQSTTTGLNQEPTPRYSYS